MHSRSGTIHAAALVVSGAAVAAVAVWASRLPERGRAAGRHRARLEEPVLHSTGHEIFGADEALRRWEPGSR